MYAWWMIHTIVVNFIAEINLWGHLKFDFAYQLFFDEYYNKSYLEIMLKQ